MQANFVVSAEKPDQCPDFQLYEYPLIGRSNVGKSSFINAIANNKKLAKTSNTPGKTRLINFFNFSDKFIIADLPGYGYAKVSKAIQDRWQKSLEEYLLNRTQIKYLIQFIDGRHEIQRNDYQMREWIQAHNLPVFTVVTKIDCVPKSKIYGVIKKIEQEFGGEVYPFSAVDKKYNENILSKLLNLNY